MVESLVIEKGWVRIVVGDYGEITGAKKYSASSKELRKFQLIDTETDVTNMRNVEIGLQTHKKKSDNRVKVTLDKLGTQQIVNIVKDVSVETSRPRLVVLWRCLDDDVSNLYY